jgi:hypothetical protein
MTASNIVPVLNEAIIELGTEMLSYCL